MNFEIIPPINSKKDDINELELYYIDNYDNENLYEYIVKITRNHDATIKSKYLITFLFYKNKKHQKWNIIADFRFCDDITKLNLRPIKTIVIEL